jgi:hypothetical protein
MEDFEYFVALKYRAARLDDQFPPHQKLLVRIEKELQVEPEIADNILDWTKDVKLLEAKRERIVALINEADAAIATYMEDARLK